MHITNIVTKHTTNSVTIPETNVTIHMTNMLWMELVFIVTLMLLPKQALDNIVLARLYTPHCG